MLIWDDIAENLPGSEKAYGLDEISLQNLTQASSVFQCANARIRRLRTMPRHWCAIGHCPLGLNFTHWRDQRHFIALHERECECNFITGC